MFIIFVIVGEKYFYLTICLCEFKFTDVNNIYEWETTECFCSCQYDDLLNVGAPICWG